MPLVDRIALLTATVRNKLNSIMPRLTPSGGSTGQILAKSADGDYATGWTSNAPAALKLATARTIQTTGDVALSLAFDGSANATSTASLATVNSNVGSFGDASTVPTITVDAKGRITAVSTVSVAQTTNAGSLTSGTLSPARFPASTGDVTSAAGTHAFTLATVNGSVGTFGSGSSVPVLTVDAKGRVTAISTVAVTAGDMYRADNLSGLANPTTARANLGLPALSLANTFDPATGPTLAVIKTDGVMEIGKYLDWHEPGSANDFDFRMTLAGGAVSFSGAVSGTTINATSFAVNGSPVPSIQQSRDNVINIGYDYTVSQLMRWKNYGGGHVIFDASNGTAPNGASVDKSNAQVAWGANYPALMGWNGSNTYGLRVDSARVADSAGSAGNASTLGGASPDVAASGNTIVKRDANGYLFVQYLNQASPNGENAGIDQVITTNGSDGYLRKAGLAYFITTALNRDIVIGNGSGGSAVARFVSNSDTGNSASATLQAYSSSGGAMMSFHRAGVYAVNMGLDSDNVFRIGGWSAPANVLQLNMGGDLTLNGAVFTRNATNYIRDVYRANSDAVNLTATGVWSAAAPVALTDAATIAVNMATFLNATVVLAGNRTLAAPSNAKPGQSGYIAIYQDGTGSRTLAYASGWKFASGTVPTLTTTANALDILHYEVISASVVVITGVLKDVK